MKENVKKYLMLTLRVTLAVVVATLVRNVVFGGGNEQEDHLESEISDSYVSTKLAQKTSESVEVEVIEDPLTVEGLYYNESRYWVKFSDGNVMAVSEKYVRSTSTKVKIDGFGEVPKHKTIWFEIDDPSGILKDNYIR